jgi:reverse gyrase
MLRPLLAEEFFRAVESPASMPSKDSDVVGPIMDRMRFLPIEEQVKEIENEEWGKVKKAVRENRRAIKKRISKYEKSAVVTLAASSPLVKSILLELQSPEGTKHEAADNS